MTKFIRKLKRRRQKELKKEASQRIKNIEESLSNMPSECSSCRRQFDNDEADSWSIKMSFEDATLLCPDCKEAQNESQG
jgi:hypothetical protein